MITVGQTATSVRGQIEIETVEKDENAGKSSSLLFFANVVQTVSRFCQIDDILLDFDSN